MCALNSHTEPLGTPRVFVSRLYALFFCLVLLSCISQSAAYKTDRRDSTVKTDEQQSISDLTLLLPYTIANQRVTYTLEAYNGCFHWTSHNPELVTVTPSLNTITKDQGHPAASPCAESAVVRVSATGQHLRASTWITAVDIHTGNELRCEVFVDTVTALSLYTKSRILYKDDLEEVGVQGYDDQGNRFSTLEGLAFHWECFSEAKGTRTDYSVVTFSKFKDSPLQSTPVLLDMEAQGMQTDTVLLLGVDVGRAQVSARLAEEGYGRVPEAKVHIVVLEPLQLFPSHLIYVPVGTRLTYHLASRRRGAGEIAMPSSTYVWSSTNTSVATVDSSGNVIAREVGRTEVQVHHTDMPESEAHAAIYVVAPHHLLIKIDPTHLPLPSPSSSPTALPVLPSTDAPSLSDWYLVTGHDYTLRVEAYDKDNHKLTYVMGNLEYTVSISKEFFDVGESSSSHDLNHVTTTTRTGVTTVTATLDSLLDPRMRDARVPLLASISAAQDAHVTSGVRILDSAPIMLPYDHRVKHSYALHASGGSGEYAWHSSDSLVVPVGVRSGVVVGHSVGAAPVTAADRRNSKNRDSVVVAVAAASRLQIRPGRVEVEVGRELLIHADMWGTLDADRKEYQFHNCTALPLEWSGDSDLFAIAKSEPATTKSSPLPCSSRTLLASRPGQTSIHVRYNNLHASVVVYAYPPLQAVSPRSPDLALVTLGSQATLSFEGGPAPWRSHSASLASSPAVPESTHLYNLKFEQPDKVRMADPKGRYVAGRYVFDVVCLAHGEQDVILTVGNTPSPDNPAPATAEASARFACYPPKLVELYIPDAAAPTNSAACGSTIFALHASPIARASPWRLADTRASPADTSVYGTRSYKVVHGDTVLFHAAVLDHLNRPFTNSSTLDMHWESTNTPLAEWQPDPAALEKAREAFSQHPRILRISRKEGECTVLVKVKGYDTAALYKVGVGAPSSVAFPLQDEARLDVIAPVIITPSRTVVVLAPSNIVRLGVTGGSGSYQFSINDTNAVHVPSAANPASWEAAASHVDLVPARPGHVRLSVQDSCMWPSARGAFEATADVVVSEVTALVPQGRDMVQIGDEIQIEVIAYDSTGARFSGSQYKYINISHYIDDTHVIQVTRITRAEEESALFNVRGLSQGVGRVVFQAGTVATRPFEVHVFPPLKLLPRSLTLLPGGYFQVHWTGGPPTGATISFRSHDDTIAYMDPQADLGVVVARRIGDTTVTGRMESADGVVYGEDSVQVVVGNFTSLRIHASSKRILEGNVIKLRVAGARGETPFTYGMLDMTFTWESLNSQVLQILAPYATLPRTGINATTADVEHGFSALVRAASAGVSRVTVRIVPHTSALSHMASLTGSVQITVLPLLTITPTPATHHYLASASNDLSLFAHSYSYSSYVGHRFANNLVLLPPNGRLDVLEDLGVEIVHHMVQVNPNDCDGVVEVQPGGVVVASSKSGVCHLIFEDRETDQAIHARIRVKPINHIIVYPFMASAAHTGTPYTVGVGETTRFLVDMGDEYGTLFHTQGDVILAHETSTAGIVAVEWARDTGTLAVTGLRPGVTVIRVYLESGQTTARTGAAPSVDDYIRVTVGKMIDPEAPVVHVGGSIVFSTSLSSRDQPVDDGAQWGTSDPAVVSVQPTTGVAAARRVGTASVWFNQTALAHPSSGMPNVHTLVEVVRIGSIKIEDTPVGTRRSRDHFSEEGDNAYYVRLSFLDTAGRTLVASPAVVHNIVFSCKVDENRWASSYATTLHASSGARPGDYCVITPLATNALLTQADPPAHLTLHVTASDSAKTYKVEQDQLLTFSYVSGKLKTFSVSPSEVQVGPGKQGRDSARVDVSVQAGSQAEAQTAIQATPVDPTKATVRLEGWNQSGALIVHTYLIEAGPAWRGEPHEDSTIIEFVNVNSQQKERVFVSLHPSPAASPVEPESAQRTLGDRLPVPPHPIPEEDQTFAKYVLGSLFLCILSSLIFHYMFNRPASSTRLPIGSPAGPLPPRPSQHFSPPSHIPYNPSPRTPTQDITPTQGAGTSPFTHSSGSPFHSASRMYTAR
eukprot:TRINITY_DN3977_c0_g1_i2.p1 TRINITY_DN3977_c0_g1~~TRINITY_DN3977_c0_g1_i2.p1  ORF type:complete len:2052 (-),score=557.76 TRINITY_DN3977_c0_g1_i2:46-6201(-)